MDFSLATPRISPFLPCRMPMRHPPVSIIPNLNREHRIEHVDRRMAEGDQPPVIGLPTLTQALKIAIRYDDVHPITSYKRDKHHHEYHRQHDDSLYLLSSCFLSCFSSSPRSGFPFGFSGFPWDFCWTAFDGCCDRVRGFNPWTPQVCCFSQ